MNCDRTEEISRLIDGEMAPAEARSIGRHLAQCSDCRQARADFLNFRSQITNYESLVDPVATRQALAKVISSEGTLTSAQRKANRKTNRSSRRPFPAFASLRFNPAFVTALALLLTGSIAFVIYRAQQESGSGAPSSPLAQVSPANSSTASPSGSQVAPGSSNPSGSEELIANNPNRKTRKAGSRETGTIRRKSNSPLRPPRERDNPKPPQVRSAAPPTFARMHERVMPGGNELNLAADLGNGNLRHLEQSELLLRAFRNIRFGKKGGGPDVSYERRRAQQLVYQNMLLRREADAAGNVEVATLLGSLEPILLDIANLRPRPRNEEVSVIRERVERQSLVPLLQVSSMAVLRPDE